MINGGLIKKMLKSLMISFMLIMAIFNISASAAEFEMIEYSA